MDLDALDLIFWGGDAETPKALVQSASPEDPSISWPEFQWRAMDKFLDADRKKRGLRAMGEKKRVEVLRLYLESIGRINVGQ